ncbi:MAG: hypothetical protein HZB16_13210 [Armatimonadetes bacterium]|nr:hypothetical protein [Armatimonadota bacterium]
MKRLLTGWVASLLLVSSVAGAPSWDSGKQGRFVMALARDAAGALWAGTEDMGVWRHDGQAWRQFTTKDGLGDDNAYAVCADSAGRVWVGHLNHGVSVYNGQTWRNYDLLTGPLGDRVHAIAAAPDGDVWMATSAGLTRYVAVIDAWVDYTIADGLPSNQFTSIAVDPRGVVYAGSACNGLAVGTLAGGRMVWRIVPGPIQRPQRSRVSGEKLLPSALINHLSITARGRVYVATNYGLAYSDDQAQTWTWARGVDWAEHVKGLADGAPRNFKADGPGTLLEDYVTFATEDAKGRLWVGHWTKGVETFDLGAGKRVWDSGTDSGRDFANAWLAVPGEAPLLAWSGGGLSQAGFGSASVAGVGASAAGAGTQPAPAPSSAAPKPVPALPKPAAPPSEKDLAQLQARLAACATPSPPGTAGFRGEDWQTQGDWVGRYGRTKGILCAQKAPLDDDMGNDMYTMVRARIGRHHGDKDSLRYWVHWLRSDDRRVLYNPTLGYRRQSDWDDHGETYAMTYDGPDMWVDVTVTAGVHRLSLYFFNKDGHDGANRWRDYLVEVKPYAADPKQAETAPTLAHCRVNRFWGGVYPQFVVTGPARYHVRIARNGSFNTIVQAVLVDKVWGELSFRDKWRQLWLASQPFGPVDQDWQRVKAAEEMVPEVADGLATAGLWRELSRATSCDGTWAVDRAARVELLRAMVAGKASAPATERLRWSLPAWEPEERKGFETSVSSAYKALRQKLDKDKGAPAG